MKQDPGLGSKFSHKIDRLINEDGSFNIKRHGGLTGIRDIYKLLIDMNWVQFILLAFVTYLAVNIFFALIYLMVGMEQISGTNDLHSDFLNAFFFSIQTLATVGYGHLSPLGLGANIVAAIESFIGLLGIALITGLLYGRFSKPTSKIAFSNTILLMPFKDEQAVMFKIVNQRNSILLNAKINVLLIIDKNDDDGNTLKDYHRLNLEIDEISFFPLTWTIVHQVDQSSPFHGLTIDQITGRNAEVIALVEAFDETHSQTLLEKHSYAGHQWKSNVKFARNFRANDHGEIELFINELDKLTPLDD